MILRLPGLMGLRHLLLDHLAQGGELGVACGIHLLGRREQRRQAVAVLDQVLLPADEVHVLQQYLHLAPDEQALEGRIVDVHIVDVDFLHLFGVGLDRWPAWPPRRAIWRCTVRANDETALSMRLSTLTRSRWMRLSSRSTWRKKPSPPRISVLYFSS